MPAYEIDGVIPVVDRTAYVHPTAVLIGDVVIGAGCYVGPLASLRGDFGRIVMEQLAWKANGTRVHQELAVRSRASLREVRPLRRLEPDRPRLPTGASTAVPLDEYRRREADQDENTNSRR